MARGTRWKVSINPSVKDIVSGAAARGLGLGTEFLLGESNKKVPHEEGTLERSGVASVDPNELRGAVSYDTPYAVRQHEDMTARHDDGRTAKYLENAMNANAGEVADIIRKTIAGEF